MNSKHIFVIGLSGPGWFEPSEARDNKPDAEKRIKDLNSSLTQKSNKSVTERLSTYKYKAVPLKTET